MHHAYVYYGSLSLLSALALNARELFGFTADNDPDVQVLNFEKFGIEESRELKESASLKPVSGRALYIVGVSQITSEAQQALLKLFEEPQEGVTFVLLVPHGSLIATLRSRLLNYPETLQQKAAQKVLGSPRPTAGRSARPDHFDQPFATTFLSASQKIRSAEVAKLLKDEDGTRERVRDFLNALETILYAALQKSKGSKEIRDGLEDIAKVRSYANDRSPALKMLLEHLALALPTLK